MITTLILFFASVILAPWWFTVLVGVYILARWNLFVPVILGGMLMDLIYGMPSGVLGMSALLYTIVFMMLAVAARYLHATMLE